MFALSLGLSVRYHCIGQASIHPFIQLGDDPKYQICHLKYKRLNTKYHWTSKHTSIHPTPRLTIITLHNFWESVMTRLTWSVTECPSMTFFRQTISLHHPKDQICHPKYNTQNTTKLDLLQGDWVPLDDCEVFRPLYEVLLGCWLKQKC